MLYSLSDYSQTAAQKGWGSGWPNCTAQATTQTVTAPISGVRVTVHTKIAKLTSLLITETERRGYLLRAGQTWGGNCRAIAGTSVPSNHSWWLAVDINSLTNPYVKKGIRVTDVPDWMVNLWNAHGFAWGGVYGDFMHWEFMGSPSDSIAMTGLAAQRLAGSSTPTPTAPKGFLMALNDAQQAELYNLVKTGLSSPIPNQVLDALVGGAGGNQALWANISQLRADMQAIKTKLGI